METMSNLESFVQELRDSLPKQVVVPKVKAKRVKKPKLVIVRDQDLQAPVINRPVPVYPIGTLFNIYKRAVPFADSPLNKIVLIGLTRDEADNEVLKLIRKEAKRRVDNSNDVFFMYEVVPMEPKNGEHSPFYNEGSPVL